MNSLLIYDVAFWLVLAAALTGVIWLCDALFLARRRRAVLAPGQPETLPWPVDYSKSFFPVIVAVLLFRSFLWEPFRIPSSSMVPNLLIGDFILVNKFDYGLKLPLLDVPLIRFADPARGDVIVFRYPKDPRKNYVKRVVGVPGDTIEYRNKTVYINGAPAAQTPLGSYTASGSNRESNGKAIASETFPDGREHKILSNPLRQAFGAERFVVPEGQYFVLGDNRDDSEDSRFWGMVPESHILGRAQLVWLSIDWSNGPIVVSRIGTVVR